MDALGPKHPSMLCDSARRACETRHLPHLLICARSGLCNRDTYVGANVENRDFDKRNVALDFFDERNHLVLFAGVTAETVGFATTIADFIYNPLQFLLATTGNAGYVAFTRKTSGNRAARGVTGANDKSGLLLLIVGPLKYLKLALTQMGSIKDSGSPCYD
ncbi:MAG: hypothetical protein RLZ68_1768 [Pseudomonadota bacterium]